MAKKPLSSALYTGRFVAPAKVTIDNFVCAMALFAAATAKLKAAAKRMDLRNFNKASSQTMTARRLAGASSKSNAGFHFARLPLSRSGLLRCRATLNAQHREVLFSVMTAARPKVSLRVQLPVYGAGFFSNSMTDVGSVILPIWLHGLGASPAMIGLVIGSRHILPFFFAIHGGALMDRLGAKRLMAMCSLLSLVLIFSFPLQTAIPVIVIMQMINGYCASMGWIGAQTAFGKLLNANPTYAGRFAFGLRMGSFVGPPIVGFAWDNIGIWGGFASFAMWSLGTLISAMMLPEIPGTRAGGPRPLRARDLVPRLSDYRSALQLAAIPVMGVVLAVTMLRVSASSIQDSFYPVYLQSIGMSATEIGLLITVSSAVAAFAALTVGPITHYIRPVWLLILTGCGSIFFVAITPFQGTFLPLAIVAALRGVCMGVSQPLMLSILADSAGAGSLGVAAALRTTANRLSSGLTPIAMGFTAHYIGLADSFLVTGAVLILMMGVIALKVWRNPKLANDDDEPSPA